MFKRLLFILLCIAGLAYAIYKVTGNTIGDAAEGANIDAVERYADTIKLSTYSPSNVGNGTANYDSANIASSVKCDRIDVSSIGVVELHGCVVGGASKKYKYVNGKASRE